MLRIVLAVASGAIGGSWFQRTIAGSVPGSVLALIGYSSFVYPLIEWHVAIHWRPLGFLVLGYLAGRLTGRRRSSFDFPLDLRIGFALFAGSLVRGLFLLMWGFPEFRRVLQWNF
jgi:hypothetical protein